jgi:signal peptidase I
MNDRSTPAPAAAPSSTPAGTRDAFQQAGAAQAAARAKGGHPKEESNIKETIESILVAFILAFIFRAFIVEAFVIPTGSMAPTLLGAHLRWDCPDCGYHFDTNYSAREADADGNPIIPSMSGPIIVRQSGELKKVHNVHQVQCPNCAYPIPQERATDVPVHYGDRILVLKFLYLFEKPQRWDVVVFKSPYDTPKYQQNYIKRLIGRPNESIVLLDGDVYVAPSHSTNIEDFTIQTKPKYAQDALWRVIYDNDYHPRGLTRGGGGSWRQPWTVKEGSGWELEKGKAGGAQRVFTFDNANSGGTITFDRDANPGAYAFSDWLAYDSEDRRRWEAQVVGDLMVKLDYVRSAGDGPLRLRLSKGEDTFTAELTPTTARLLKRTGNGADGELASAALKTGKRPTRIEFENVDYRVALRVNGSELLHTTPQQYQPDKKRLLEQFEARQSPPPPSVEITAERQAALVSHVSLYRDIYYLNRGQRADSSKTIWASPMDFPENVINLDSTDYFVLGDNSLMSLDARMWNEPIALPWEDLNVEAGRVPDRFMLGKAFFVYWPAGYRPFEAAPAITPNFGDMRFIR